jgi:hypothetical protein
MMNKKRKTTIKAKNKKMSRQKASKNAVAMAPKKAALSVRKKAVTRGSIEFVRTEPSVTVYEVVETEVYGESNPEVDDREEKFGT